MAETETTVPFDDSELFAAATAPDPPRQEEAPAETAEAKASEQPRDEHGRFAPKPATTDAAPTQQPPEAEQKPAPTETPQQTDDAAQVPSWRLREVREAREAAERRAEEASRQSYALQQQLMQMRQEMASLRRPQPQEPVDFFQDPEAALRQRIDPIQSEIENFKSQIRLEMSRELAVIKHGEKAVTEMEDAVSKAMQQPHSPDMIALAAQMRASANPADVAMQWHKRAKMMEATGGDPDAYRQRILDEALKNPEFLAKAVDAVRAQANGGQPQQQSGTRPVVQLPPSLNKATGAGISTAVTDDSDMSDRALFRYATAPGRR